MIQEVSVARDDQDGISRTGQREQIVVLGVSQDGLRRDRVRPMQPNPSKGARKLLALPSRQAVAKVATVETSLYLAEQLVAHDHFSRPRPYGTHKLRERRVGRSDRRRQQHARVDYEARQCDVRRASRAAWTPSSVASASLRALRSFA